MDRWQAVVDWDKLDMAMTLIGFIPGLEVAADRARSPMRLRAELERAHGRRR